MDTNPYRDGLDHMYYSYPMTSLGPATSLGGAPFEMTSEMIDLIRARRKGVGQVDISVQQLNYDFAQPQ